MKFIRKINGDSIFLIIMCMSITISFFYFMVGIEKQMLLEKIGQGDFNKGATHFCYNRNTASFQDIVSSFQNSNQNNFALLYDDYSSNIRQIFIKGEYNSSPLISGRFFNEKDFNKNKKLAVIGKNYIANMLEENGQKYIQIENQKFQVIGIMGMNIDTGLDDRIIINADALYKEVQNNIFILDSNYNLWGNSSIDIFNKIKNANRDISLESLDIEPVGIGHVIKNNINLVILSGLMLISYLWCSLTVVVDWIHEKNKRISIMDLIGCSDIEIIRYIFIEYFTLVFVGFGLGVLIAKLLKLNLEDFGYTIIVLLIVSIVGSLAVLIAVKKNFKIILAERIR